MNTSRQFLIQAPIFLGAMTGRKASEQTPAAFPPSTPGAPPTFVIAPAEGPEVSPATFAEAEKLGQIMMTPAQREMAAKSWRRSMAATLRRPLERIRNQPASGPLRSTAGFPPGC